ncbi:hypothetical protein [Bradyrhizobium sp. ORS 111]
MALAIANLSIAVRREAPPRWLLPSAYNDQKTLLSFSSAMQRRKIARS